MLRVPNLIRRLLGINSFNPNSWIIKIVARGNWMPWMASVHTLEQQGKRKGAPVLWEREYNYKNCCCCHKFLIFRPSSIYLSISLSLCLSTPELPYPATCLFMLLISFRKVLIIIISVMSYPNTQSEESSSSWLLRSFPEDLIINWMDSDL